MVTLKNRIAVVCLILTMLTGLAPNGGFFTVAASAATLNPGDIVMASDELGITQHYQIDNVVPNDGAINTGYHNQVLLVADAGPSGTRIIVDANVNVVLILNEVDRSASRAPLELKAGAVATLLLVDGTENSFTCTGTTGTQTSPEAGINVAPTARLRILAEAGNTGRLVAIGGHFSAGIGAGANQSCGAITIAGGVIEATSGIGLSNGSGNGAGIGGGGGQSTGGGKSAGILICGQAEVTAISRENGAGIGGGGGGVAVASANQISGGTPSGNITISGDATVTAISRSGGAGIGGGGGASNTAAIAGAAEKITISGNAIVSATSERSAGIGGGAATVVPGSGGEIEIFDTPIVVAKSNSLFGNAVDMGPGVSASNLLGVAGDVTIIGGNVYAQRTTTATNGVGDTLVMTAVTPPVPAGISVSYAITGTTGNYTYQAIADNQGKTYVWLPSNSSQYIREIVVTVMGEKEGGGLLYSMDFHTDGSVDPYIVSPSTLPVLTPMWKLKSGEVSKLTVAGMTQNKTVTLIYESGLADVALHAREYGTNASLLAVTVPDREIGTSYSHMSFALPGYQLVDSTTGANTASGSQTITVDATAANNELVFYYKLATGNQLVIYQDAETQQEIGRERLIVPVNIATPMPCPAIANYTTTATAQSVTWDGSSTLPDITYTYLRDKEILTLQAYNALSDAPIGAINLVVPNLRVLEVYNYTSDIAGLTSLVNSAYPSLYTLTPQGSTQWHMSTNSVSNVVKVYYTPLQSGTVPVECRLGNQSGQLFHGYAVPAIAGQSVALSTAQMPDFSAFDFAKDIAASQLTATEGTGQTIILVYQDNRFVTTIANDLDGIVITEKSANGDTKMLYPPYKAGYVATSYSVNGGPSVAIAPTFSGYSTTSATTITFHYESYQLIQATGDLTIRVTDEAGVPLPGVVVNVSVNAMPLIALPTTDTNGELHLANAVFGGYAIAVSHSGYQNAAATIILNTVSASQTVQIGLARITSGGSGAPEASLIIRYVDEYGGVIFEQTFSAVAGKSETIYAPPLKGYELAQGEPSSRNHRITAGKNEVIFRYATDIFEMEEPRIPTGDGTRPPVSSAVKETLETEEHIRYIQGFPDGTVRPDSNITRAEAVVIFWRLVRSEDKSDATGSRFSDVNGDEWHAQAVNYLAQMGVITGYEDGAFRPENSITRAEFATMVSRFDKLESAAIEPFTDVPQDHWAHSYIISTYLKGWMNGYSGKAFYPESPITRAEVVITVNCMLGRWIRAQDIPTQLHGLYPDLSTSHWAFAEIIEASVEHGYERQESGYEIHVKKQ